MRKAVRQEWRRIRLPFVMTLGIDLLLLLFYPLGTDPDASAGAFTVMDRIVTVSGWLVGLSLMTLYVLDVFTSRTSLYRFSTARKNADLLGKTLVVFLAVLAVLLAGEAILNLRAAVYVHRHPARAAIMILVLRPNLFLDAGAAECFFPVQNALGLAVQTLFGILTAEVIRDLRANHLPHAAGSVAVGIALNVAFQAAFHGLVAAGTAWIPALDLNYAHAWRRAIETPPLLFDFLNLFTYVVLVPFVLWVLRVRARSPHRRWPTCMVGGILS